MWKLKIVEGRPWLSTTNNHVGRQHWEFDHEAVTAEERAEVERVREEFKKNRFIYKQSADLLMRMQNEDRGWGIHIEGHSTIFGSCLNYVALRLLGQGPEDGPVARARKWIHDHGGAVGIPSWGKFWLTASVSERLKAVAKAGKMLCYCRLVYMPMSYLYEKRYVGPITALVQSLRNELYTEPYQDIDWDKARNTCAKEDLYYPHPLVQDMVWGFLHHFAEPILTRWPFSKLRDKALDVAMEHVHYEDENSKYMYIGCVEKVLCLIACHVEDPESEAYKRHLARIPDYLGSLKMSNTFSVQAIISSNLAEEYGPTLEKAHEFLKASQVRDNPLGDYTKMYRHTSKGSWTFAMQDHGWQVSDRTSEALKAVLLLSQLSPKIVGEEVETKHLYDAVNVILSLQSRNGGFPAWEPQRAFQLIAKFNPTEFFEDVLIERNYVECTSSAVRGLALFKKLHPGHKTKEIDICISKSIKYIEETQNPDGSWYGCWGICFTYGTWFAVSGLASCGKSYHNSRVLRKACKFLLSKQLPDGGWGESYLSSSNKAHADPEPIHRGMRLLINSQMKNGDFPQQEITGVFIKNCTLNYSSYRNIFPMWALGEYQRVLYV